MFVRSILPRHKPGFPSIGGTAVPAGRERRTEESWVLAVVAPARQTDSVLRRVREGRGKCGGTRRIAPGSAVRGCRLATVAAVLGVVLGAASPVTAAETAGPRPWPLVQANIGDAQVRGHDGQNITVAVVDGFVDGTHPDFRNADGGSRVLTGADCRSGSCTATSAPADQCGHGTHVAGTVAGATYGVAPRALILSVTVLAQDSSGTCSGSPDAVAAGIIWAANHGAQIINVSLGDSRGPALLQGPGVTAAIRAAATAGALVVVAAGNNGSTSGTPDYDGNALVVAATGPTGQLAAYSNRGSRVELAAPGGDSGDNPCTPSTCITSTWLDHGYALLAGTSMAAPIVSGAAALLLGANPRLSRFGVATALEATANSLPGAGSGLIDIDAAVRNVLGLSPAPSTATPSPTTVEPTPAASLVIPAGQTPATTTARGAESSNGPHGPWQVALLLVVAMGIASGAALLRRTD